MEKENLKRRLTKYLEEPAFRAAIEGIGLDPDKMKEDIERLFEIHPDPGEITLLWPTGKKRAVEKTLEDLSGLLPTKRLHMEPSEEDLEQIRVAANKLSMFYYGGTDVHRKIDILVAAALLRHWLERIGDPPRHFYPSIALLAEAHRGNYEPLKRAHELLKGVDELSPEEENELALKLKRMGWIPIAEEYIERLERLVEEHRKRRKGPFPWDEEKR